MPFRHWDRFGLSPRDEIRMAAPWVENLVVSARKPASWFVILLLALSSPLIYYYYLYYYYYSVAGKDAEGFRFFSFPPAARSLTAKIP